MTSLPENTAASSCCVTPLPQLAYDRALHLLARGLPLGDLLAELTRVPQTPDMSHRSAIFLVAGKTPRAIFGAAPQMDPAYAQLFHSGLEVGLPTPFKKAFACQGLLVCKDIQRDDSWAAYRDSPALVGIRSIWLQAVRSYNGSPIGMLLVHPSNPSEPTAADIQLILTAAKLTALAILRHDAEMDRLDLQASLRSERIDRDAISLELQQAARAREEFMCIAAHELRTPLSALMLQADSAARLMRREQTDPVRLRNKVASIQTQIDRLKHLVEGLLDQSQIVDGQLKLNCTEVDLVAITQEAIGRVADAYKRARCELHFDSMGPVTGEWDGLRLGQVVNNLLVNALKYGQGKPVEVRVQGTPDSGILVVSDHGIGIPPSAQRRIFQRFGRAVSETHFGGFGTGLWLSKMIIDALGGTVTVQSDVDAGAIFTVVLPRHRRRYFAPLSVDPVPSN